MKRIALLLALLLPLTAAACSQTYVPPADYDETEPVTAAETALESDTEPVTAVTTKKPAPARSTTTAAQTAAASASDTTAAPESTEETDDSTGDTDSSEETNVIPDWAEAYARLLRQKDARSAHVDAYYALIQLDPDEIPELVLLDDAVMELYACSDGKAELLMEDAYKSSAASGQNVCFQPLTGRFASYFTTMGNGDGYNIFVYAQADPLHVERLCFNNSEDDGGEMPYNPIWDSAEEYEVINGGYHDVTLGSSWVHIGVETDDDGEELSRFDALYDLTAAEPQELAQAFEIGEQT